MKRSSLGLVLYLAGCGTGVQGTLQQLDLDLRLPPLEGATVCIRGGGACATTDANGRFDLEEASPPIGAEYELTAAKSGHVGLLYLRVRHARDARFGYSLATEGYYADRFATAGATIPSGTGMVWVNDVSHREGVSAELVGQPQALRFFSENSQLVRNRDGTTKDGLILFAGVEPGQVTIRLLPAPGQAACRQRDNGFSGGAPGTIAVPVEAGLETNIEVLCE